MKSRHHGSLSEMRAQAAGYAWRIQNPAANPLDWQAFDACLRGTENEHDHHDEAALHILYDAWMLGVADADLPHLPILSIPDAAKIAGVSARYINNEIHDMRLDAEGEGKMMRLSYAEFYRWLSVAGRGRRRKG